MIHPATFYLQSVTSSKSELANLRKPSSVRSAHLVFVLSLSNEPQSPSNTAVEIDHLSFIVYIPEIANAVFG
ncbi:MAG TPA: hypothetical protein PLD12_11660 [Bacteroidales bacterium]|nr:hypothetical protein [Bacteroidales bacterium]HPO66574.1 hypothetical protein [Bacteroidales bacterium]